jgi:Asp-tRNA(Asn)/Glu-tRNA(Gln) amidotransferase A subunit family amidase
MTQWLTAVELAQSVTVGTLSADMITTETLKRIASHDSRLNAFLAVSETAHDAAKAVIRSPVQHLAGVPIAIKDLVDTAGLATTYGSRIFKDNVPAEDDLVVARLRAAGAVIIGKTMTPEFGFGAICGNALKAATCILGRLILPPVAPRVARRQPSQPASCRSRTERTSVAQSARPPASAVCCPCVQRRG